MNNAALAAILDHLCNEARNSLHAVLGVIEVAHLESEGLSWEPYSTGVRATSERLLRVIDDLRELAATEPYVDGEPVRFDAALSLGEIVELLNLVSSAEARVIQIDAPPRPLFIAQRQQHVEFVLTRLLDSASKLASGGPLCVQIRREPATNGISVSIAPPASPTTARIMEWLSADLDRAVFEESDDTGHVLGVMVAGKRLRALGANARLSPSPESGEPSRLIIDFPSLPESDASPDSSSSAGTFNILVAEDCDDSFRLTALMLAKENVQRAHDGQEAIELVKKHRFDVVFMDVHMPRIDGYSALRAIRAWETETGNARTPVVILSSDNLETQRRSAANSGCSGFLRKPLRRHHIEGVLETLRRARALEIA